MVASHRHYPRPPASPLAPTTSMTALWHVPSRHTRILATVLLLAYDADRERHRTDPYQHYQVIGLGCREDCHRTAHRSERASAAARPYAAGVR